MVSRLAEGAGEDTGRQRQLLEIVRSAGLRMVGPSTLGVLNNDASVSLRGTFAGAPVPAGRLAISSQSGAIGIALLGDAAARRLGLSSFASLGGRADAGPTTCWSSGRRKKQGHEAVILLVETFGKISEHSSPVARRVGRRKAILAIKGRRVSRTTRRGGLAHRGRSAWGCPGRRAPASGRRDALHSGEELLRHRGVFENQPLRLGTGWGSLATPGVWPRSRSTPVGRVAWRWAARS